MNVVIVEDEKLAAKKLIRLLNEIDSTISLTEVLESVEDATNWFLAHPPPDLVFMDIQLEDGLAFEIFERCEIKTPIIFTTAYDEYTLKAFKVNSIDYLLKPIKLDELKDALSRYNEIHRDYNFAKIETSLSQLLPRQKERFLIKIGEHYKSIETPSINCFYIKERYNFISGNGGRNFPSDYSLDKIEEMVDGRMFFRINRNMIVNFSSIEDILAYSSSRLKLKLKDWSDPEDIMVSRDRVSAFKKWMDR